MIAGAGGEARSGLLTSNPEVSAAVHHPSASGQN